MSDVPRPSNATKYLEYFRKQPIAISIPCDIEGEELGHVAKSIFELHQSGLFLHCIIGANSQPFDSEPTDDDELSVILRWYEGIIHSATARLREALDHLGIDGIPQHPFKASISQDGFTIDQLFLDSENIPRPHLKNIPIWVPLIIANGKRWTMNPWMNLSKFTATVADNMNAIKLVFMLSQDANSQLQQKFLSCLTVDDIEKAVYFIQKTYAKTTSMYCYQMVSALKAASLFVKKAPETRRGHLINIADHSLEDEILTIDGIGTMVADCAIPTIPSDITPKYRITEVIHHQNQEAIH